MDNSNEYTLKLDGGGLSFERVVSEEVVRRVIGLVLGGVAQQQNKADQQVLDAPLFDQAGEGTVLSPKAFLNEKRPMNETERLVCLAYYLAHYRQTANFKTRDLNDLNREAAQPRMSNASVTARNATNQRYLTLAGGGQKTITSKGEDLVRALPDREKVKLALENHPLTRKLKRKKKAST